MMSKSEVNGNNVIDIYKYLRQNSRLYDKEKDEARVVPWNFTKFLVNCNDGSVQYFNPRTTKAELQKAIETVLGLR